MTFTSINDNYVSVKNDDPVKENFDYKIRISAEPLKFCRNIKRGSAVFSEVRKMFTAAVFILLCGVCTFPFYRIGDKPFSVLQKYDTLHGKNEKRLAVRTLIISRSGFKLCGYSCILFY